MDTLALQAAICVLSIADAKPVEGIDGSGIFEINVVSGLVTPAL